MADVMSFWPMRVDPSPSGRDSGGLHSKLGWLESIWKFRLVPFLMND
jgi:hypothetical protein